MKKIVKSLVVSSVVLASSTASFAATMPQGSLGALQNATSLERQITSNVTLTADQSSVKYSKFLENGGGELWVKLTLDGAKFNTNDPYKIKDSISQNYDIKTTLAVGNDGKSIELGVYQPNANIEYLENWDITIDSSVLTSDSDINVKIPVINDIVYTSTPKVKFDKTSITLDELKNGFDITLETTNGSMFNTRCSGGFIRQSIMRTSNIDVFPIAYCDGIDSTKVKLHIRALNDVPYYRDELVFRIEGNASNSTVPLIVNLPIVR